MDLKQLKYFVRVADTGSFTKAAAMLSIAQSALSHHVRQLEVELKQTLLYRNGRGVVPTDAGQRLADYARGILAQVQRAQDDITDYKGPPRGHVIIGMPTNVAEFLAVPLIKDFRKSFPQATISVVQGMSATLADWLTIGRTDISLAYNPMPSAAIDICPFLDEQMYLVGRKSAGTNAPAESAPLGLKDLPKWPLIVPPHPNAKRTLLEVELAALGRKLNIGLEIDGVSLSLELIRAGFGSAVFPYTIVASQELHREFDVRPIVRPELKMSLGILTSAHQPITPLEQAVLARIKAMGPGVLMG